MTRDGKVSIESMTHCGPVFLCVAIDSIYCSSMTSALSSEDSDIIAFGAETVMFKMDREGNGQEYRKKLLGACDKCAAKLHESMLIIFTVRNC